MDNPFIKVDIDTEVDPPLPVGLGDIEVPSSAYVAYVIDVPGAQYGEKGRYDSYEVAAVPASSLDVVKWQHAHGVFRSRVLEARVRLQSQVDAFEAAKAKYIDEVLAATDEYQATHAEIEARKAMVEAEDELRYERDQADLKARQQVALEAEDAVLGKRNWVLYRGMNNKKTLHFFMCSRFTRSGETSRWSKLMRVADARSALAKDNVKACKRCYAEDQIRQAGYGNYTGDPTGK